MTAMMASGMADAQQQRLPKKLTGGAELTQLGVTADQTQRASRAGAEAPGLRAAVMKLYIRHEAFLFLMYSRHSRLSHRLGWLSDPLARWREFWRLFGLLLLVFNAAVFTSAAWSLFRCEVDESCDASLVDCPRAVEWLRDADGARQRLRELQPPVATRCRHELLTWGSGRAVQLFALGELALGVRTATTAALQPSGLLPQWAGGTMQYGTTVGRVAYALFALDTLLSVPWYTSTRTPIVPKPPQSLHKTPFGPLVGNAKRLVKDNIVVRTVVGYKRMKSVPPAPTPAQHVVDEYILPAVLGTGNEATINGIKMLPAIGDAIYKAQLVQAFFACFLAAAKMTVLAGSELKAARMRQLLLSRNKRAACRIVAAMRAMAARS